MKYSGTFALIVIVGLVACSTALPAKKPTTNAHGIQSVVETYPEDNELKVVVTIEGKFITALRDAAAPADDEDAVVTGADATAAVEIENTAAKAYREYNFDAIETPVAPIAATRFKATRYRRSIPDNSNQNQSAESAATNEKDVLAIEVAEEEDEETYAAPPAPVTRARHLTKKAIKPDKAAQDANTKVIEDPEIDVEAGTFFPIDFGGTVDDAIAVSTGAGSHGSSNAIAYGPTVGTHPQQN